MVGGQMGGRTLLACGSNPEDRTLVESAAATLSLKSQMESLHIGGQIPGSVLGAPPPYQRAGSLLEKPVYAVTTKHAPVGESASNTSSRRFAIFP
ncbi:hypothetical protein COOONC_27854 [Cooperia oncophora]